MCDRDPYRTPAMVKEVIAVKTCNRCKNLKTFKETARYYAYTVLAIAFGVGFGAFSIGLISGWADPQLDAVKTGVCAGTIGFFGSLCVIGFTALVAFMDTYGGPRWRGWDDPEKFGN